MKTITEYYGPISLANYYIDYTYYSKVNQETISAWRESYFCSRHFCVVTDAQGEGCGPTPTLESRICFADINKIQVPPSGKEI